VRKAIDEKARRSPVPLEIRNAPTRLMGDLGYGRGYVYAPDTDEGVGGLECLPNALRGTRFYEPKGEGFETELRARLERFQAARAAAKKKS
jgi:putative ATPase